MLRLGTPRNASRPGRVARLALERYVETPIGSAGPEARLRESYRGPDTRVGSRMPPSLVDLAQV